VAVSEDYESEESEMPKAPSPNGQTGINGLPGREHDETAKRDLKQIAATVAGLEELTARSGLPFLSRLLRRAALQARADLGDIADVTAEPLHHMH
jgi:hypothetical protein